MPDGPTLCAPHARQATSGAHPSGLCYPEQWLNGRGEPITCDVVADPPKVIAYVEKGRPDA